MLGYELLQHENYTWHVFLLTLGIMEDDMIHRVRVQVRDNRLVGHLVKKASALWSKRRATALSGEGIIWQKSGTVVCSMPSVLSSLFWLLCMAHLRWLLILSDKEKETI